jgi:hypothetical protein
VSHLDSNLRDTLETPETLETVSRLDSNLRDTLEKGARWIFVAKLRKR